MADTTTIPAKIDNGQVRRHDPYEVFDVLHDELARLWGQSWPFWPAAAGRRLAQTIGPTTAWTPRVDVFEKNGQLVVKAELPGVKKEDIEVNVDQGDLIIRGERKAESEVKDEHYYRMERTYGGFYRRMTLPAEVEAEKIAAKFADGVLEVQIPKPVAQKPRPQTIKVH